MKRTQITALGATLLLGALQLTAAQAAEDDPLDAQRKAEIDARLLLVKVHGRLTSEASQDLVDAVARARQAEPRIRYVVFELDTPGGDLKAATILRDMILGDLKSCVTAAYIPDGREARAEGLLVAFSVRRKLFVGARAQLGADASRPPSSADDEALRDALRAVAKEQGCPQYLLDAMATEDHPDIFLVVERKGAQGAEEKRFLSRSELEDRKKPGQRPLVREELIAPAKRKLVLSADDAVVRFEIARLAGDLLSVREALGLTLPDENVILLGQGVLRPASPGAQKVIDILNHSVVRFLILLVACLAALIEIKTAGSFLAGMVSVICFGVFFLAASFPTTGNVQGTASLWEIILFVIGLALLGVEFFLLPGMGIFAISGAALCAVTIVLAMVPADSSQLTSGGTMTDAVVDSLAILAYGFGGGCLFFLAVLKLFSRRAGLAGRGLVTTTTITGVSTAESALQAQAAEAALLDREGVASTLLRPAGKVQLDDGQLLDVVTDGELIEKGTRVRVIATSGGVIKVARIEGPGGR